MSDENERSDPPAPVQIPSPSDWPPTARAAVPIRAEAPPPAGPPAPPPVDQTPAPEAPRKPRKSFVRRVAVGAVKLVFALVAFSLLWVAAYRFVAPPITATMVGDLVAGRGVTKHWLPLSRIDPDMARAAIAAEDSGFCRHSGFDVKAIEAAWRANQRGRRIRGGSTISQQTAKNVFLWQGGGYFRKGLEAYFTVLIETIWGKRRIMEVYLNVAETGIGTYGVDAGARRYFRHDATRLSAREAAQIAAVLPLPKKRAGTAPSGFTRRYGNSIAAGIGTVREQGLDACLD